MRTTLLTAATALSLLATTYGCAAPTAESTSDDATESTTADTYGSFGGFDDDTTASDAPGVVAAAAPAAPSAEEPAAPAETPAATPDPGPAPTKQCTVSKDANGFFWRSSTKSDYVAYVPASYSPTTPMRLIVGLHGCSDNAMNFATWGVNPWENRATQDHIGISVSGESGNNKCWSMGVDDDKVLAAIADISSCFWVDQSKIVVAGYSSGGQLAYRVGLKHADKFAGILIENSGLYAAGLPSADLLAGAAWKLNIAHRASTSDSVFPIAKVKGDWAATTAAGFPIATSEVSGGHDGKGADWSGWLIPQSASWVKTP